MCQVCRDGFEVEEEHREDCGVLLHEKLDLIVKLLQKILNVLENSA